MLERIVHQWLIEAYVMVKHGYRSDFVTANAIKQ